MRRHRQHDGLHPRHLPLVDVESVELLPHAGEQFQDALDGPHAAQHPVALEEVVEGELAGAQPALHVRLLVFGDGGLGLLDQRQHVAHPEDPRRHPIGVEHLELVELLADRGKLDGLAGDRLDGERSPASSIAVELRQHDAVEGNVLLERLGDVHGLLSRHRVEDEQDVERLDGIANARQLVHQRVVDAETAGCVDDDDIEPVCLRALEALHRGTDGILRVGAVHGDRDLLAELFELIDRGRPLQISCDEAWLLALPAQVERKLGGGGRLARALQAGHQDDGRGPSERQLGVSRAHQLREVVVHELDDVLPGVEPPEDVLPESLGLDAGDEVLDDLEVDVGLEQREPNLAHRLVDIFFVQPLGAAEVTQGRLEPVGERVEHGREVYGRPPAIKGSTTRALCGPGRQAAKRCRSDRSCPGPARTGCATARSGRRGGLSPPGT